MQDSRKRSDSSIHKHFTVTLSCIDSFLQRRVWTSSRWHILTILQSFLKPNRHQAHRWSAATHCRCSREWSKDMNQTIRSSWANEIIIAINHFFSISPRIHIVIQADVLILQHGQFRRHIRATDHVNSRWLLSQIWLRQWWCKMSDLSTQKFRMQLESQLASRHLLSLWLSSIW